MVNQTLRSIRSVFSTSAIVKHSNWLSNREFLGFRKLFAISSNRGEGAFPARAHINVTSRDWLSSRKMVYTATNRVFSWRNVIANRLESSTNHVRRQRLSRRLPFPSGTHLPVLQSPRAETFGRVSGRVASRREIAERRQRNSIST